ncbi:S-layer protein, partial [archaeon]|nr:S-layer protein [archaeon]
MKNINMKKIVAGAAALGVSALLAGSVVAANVNGDDFGSFNELTKDQLFTSGVPAYNIVVGSMGQTIDVVWAGNIAAAIGKKAYMSAEEAGTGSYTFNNVVVTVGTEAGATVTGDGYLSDGYEINDMSITSKVIDESDYSMMYKVDTSADSEFAGASTLTISDSLAVQANVYFNKNKNVKDLVASIDKGAITYTVDLDEGIFGTYKDSSASPRLKFEVMGKNYTVDSFDGTTLKLIQNLATQTYAPGATFEADDYTIEVVNILDTGATEKRYQVEMNLIDSTGNPVATEVYKTGDTKIFDSFLTASIDVDTVYATMVKIIAGSSGTLEIKDGSKVNDFPNIDDKLWKAKFYGTNINDKNGSTILTGFSLTTDDTSQRYTNDDSLRIGDSIE